LERSILADGRDPAGNIQGESGTGRAVSGGRIDSNLYRPLTMARPSKCRQVTIAFVYENKEDFSSGQGGSRGAVGRTMACCRPKSAVINQSGKMYF